MDDALVDADRLHVAQDLEADVDRQVGIDDRVEAIDSQDLRGFGGAVKRNQLLFVVLENRIVGFRREFSLSIEAAEMTVAVAEAVDGDVIPWFRGARRRPGRCRGSSGSR